MTTAISTRQPKVTIKYGTVRGRVKKHFEDANKAKAFFVAKDKAGKASKVLGDQSPSATWKLPT